MNRNYKIILRKTTGEFVVASEHAKGSKKSKVSGERSKFITRSIVMSVSSVWAISAYAAQTVALDASYFSGALVSNASAQVTGVDSTGSANLQKKMKVLGTGGIASADGKYSTDLKQNTEFLPNPKGPTTAIPIETLNLAELTALGAINIKDKNTGATLTTSPVWDDWNLNAADGKKEVTWEKSDGSQGTVAIYDVDKIYIKNQNVDSLNFTAERITNQPTEPFYKFTMEKITKGELTLQGDKIDWKPGQVKQSSLFIADGSAAKIEQKTPIKVTFANTASLAEFTKSSPVIRDFGPTKILSGATLDVDGQKFTIDSVGTLKSFNNALIKAITNNVISSSEYASRFNKAFKNGADLYQIVYDPSAGYEGDNNYYFSEAMLAAIGKRAIFEGTKGAQINLYENVAAIGETWARAYNVWLHDQGVATNLGNIDIAHADTQNALVESGSSYTNKGSLNFNVARNGTNWADQVTGAGSTYKNEGTISVSSSAKRSPNAVHPNEYYKASRNVALEILKGASAENSASGQFFIGTSAGAGTATGVHINESGTFVNKGSMTVGKNAAGQDQTLSGGVNSETLNLDESFAAVSAYVNESNSSNKVRMINDGTIDINQTAKNTAAINIGFKDPTIISSKKIDVEVSNTGKILVDGSNSAGLKASGFKTIKADGIKNTGDISVSGLGSSGIFAANGAEIVNDGNVTVDGRQVVAGAKNRPYGIRSDNALVRLESNSEVEVLGSYSVGLYARVGGTIAVNGGSIAVPQQSGSKGQVVFWISGKNDQGKSSEINFANPTAFDLDNDSSTLFRIDNKATYVADAANKHTMNINGKDSTGYYISDKGTTFDSGQSEINVNGDASTGIYVNGGAGLDNKVVLSDKTQLNISGKNATVAVVDGNKYDILGNATDKLGARLISKANLSSGAGGNVASGAIGYWLLNTGELQHEGSIDFTQSKNATGVKVEGGTLSNTADGRIAVDGVGIDVYAVKGSESVVNNLGDVKAVDGIAAIRLNEGAKLELKGSAAKVVKGEKNADAVRVHAGASLKTNNANLEVDGQGSGIHFLNTDGGSSQAFKLTGSGTINVKGKDAAGITLEGQDANGNPMMGSSNLDSRGSEKLIIHVKDAGGNGIVTNTSGSVASGTSVNIESASGQSALKVLGKTESVIQTGNLNSNSATAVVDLSQSNATKIAFENSGSIISKAAGGVAVNANLANKPVSFVNKDKGSIQGAVQLGNGANSIINQDKGSIQGKISAGNGVNTVKLSDQSSTDEIVLGNGANKINLSDQSSANSIQLGNGANTVTVAGQSTLEKLTAGDGANQLTLKDKSKTKEVVLGNGGNSVDIYAETDNGTLLSGSGDDQFTLHGVKAKQSNIIFDKIEAGDGVDSLTVTENSEYVLNDSSKISNFENLNIQKNSIFEIDNVELALNSSAANSGIVNIDKDSTYFVNFDRTNSDYILDKKLAGEGTLQTNTNGRAFDFDAASAIYSQNNFSGTLQLAEGTLALENQNTQALSNATLQLDPNGIATVKSGQGLQKIAGLRFNEGSLNFEQDFIGSKTGSLNSHLEVKVLDVSKKGQVNIITDGFDNDFDEKGALKDATQLTLLEQDDGVNLVELVKASDEVIGDAIDINVDILTSKGDIVTTPDSIEDIRQAGNVVAKGTYGIGATVFGPSNLKDGLYAAYMLKKVAILDQQSLNLESAADATGKGLQFSAQISNDSGSGNLIINANGDHVELLNSNNDYSGTTTVNKGLLILGADTVLGQENQHTSALILQPDTQVQFANTTQYIGALNSAAGSTVALDSGTLHVDQGGLVDGNLTSSSDALLDVEAGILTVNGAHPDFHGKTQIQAPASININDVQGLGDGDIDVAGQLNIHDASGDLQNNLSNSGNVNINGTSDVVLQGDNSAFLGAFNNSENSQLTASEANHLGTATVNNQGIFVVTGTSDWKVDNTVQGTGQLVKKGSNTIELSANAAGYTGNTSVETGSLVVGTKDSPIDLLSKALIIQADGSFAGFGSSAGSVDNSGRFIVGELDKNNSTAISQYQVKGNFNNKGSIVLGGASGTGSVLAIGGDYISNGGKLYLNTVLNEGLANTQTDQMKVAGDVVMGSAATSIYVKPVGGDGAETVEDAIKVVDVAGKTAANAFTLANPVAVGIYEYSLHQGSKDQSWYLSTYVEPEPPVDPKPPVKPPVEPPVDPKPPVKPPVEPPVDPKPPVKPPVEPPVEPKLPVIPPVEPPVEPKPPVTPPVEPPVEPKPPVTPPVEPPVKPEPVVTPVRHVSPMVGAYLANQNALMMFNMTLHDRLGEPQYAQALKSDSTANSMWLRSVVSSEQYHVVDGALKLNGDHQLIQIGTDVIAWDQFNNNQNYRARLGLMAGFGQLDYDSSSKTTGSKAFAKIENAYSAGIYGTIYQDSDTPLATYIDAWATYNWYDNNQVGMQGYDTAKYDSEGYNMSVEAGHTFIRTQNFEKNSQWQLQPQVQLTYGTIDTDASVHNSGLSLKSQDSQYLESRVGGRISYMKDFTAADQIQPFAEFNWHHQYEQMDLRLNSVTVGNDYPKDRYQFKLGFEGNSSNHFNGWGNISYSFGDHHYQQVEAMAGIKYQW